MGIERPDDIKPAFAGQNAGRIGDPELIRTLGFKLPDPVWCDRAVMPAIGRCDPKLRTLAGPASLLAHESGNPVVVARTTQHLRQSRAAIGIATARKLIADALAQRKVGPLPRAGLLLGSLTGIIAAAQDEQSLAQPRRLVLAAHCFDSGIPLGDISERVPSDFSRTSRCSNSFAFSSSSRRISGSPLALLLLAARSAIQ